MNNKTLDLRIDNAETSASTGTQNKESMSKETFTLPTSQKAQNQYDNIGAYNQLQAMMKAGQKLSVKFYTGKDNKPCAWIESKQVTGFRYELKDTSFKGLMNYLISGEVAGSSAFERGNQLCPLSAEVDAGRTLGYPVHTSFQRKV